MTVKTTDYNLQWFVDTVLLGDLKKMIFTDSLHYLGFGVVSCGIEFLGACIDENPFEAQNLSRQRFESAIKTLFDAKYHAYADKESAYDLYKHLRCGMAHIMRPTRESGFYYS